MPSAEEIGASLRRIREEKGLSPDQVQVETKIRLRYLEALESGDESIIPGEVYYKGFLRFYANHLGLDGHALVEQYKEWKDTQRTEQERAAAEADTKSARKPRVTVNRRRLAMVILALALLAVLVVGGVWGFTIYRQRTVGGGDNDQPPVVAPGGTTPGGTTPPVTPPPVTPTVEVVKEDLGAAGLRYRATGTSIKVEVEAAKLCWVQVTSDGTVIFMNDLAPGAKAVWEAKERLVVLYGNIGGVKFSVNGVPQDVAGREGDVRTVTYEPKK